ncbi:MAG: hypothetical protein EOO04_18565 [Chitinophagaceae bacterium]|nr:MAG: hypothetical protein EOO04_18565 [Chitinophagaceae bacterium]
MRIAIFFLLVIAISSCKKDDVQTPESTPTPPGEIFPNFVNSDPKSEFFIEAEYNGKKICLSTQNSSIDTFSNVYYYYPATGQDQLNLIRENKERSAQMQIYIGQSMMLFTKLPYSVPNDHLVFCEFTQFQFYDEGSRHGTENGPNDNYTYQASTNTGMKMTVTSFVDNILEGSFEGTLRTNTGRTMEVKNGSFRIRLYIKTGDY